MTDLRPSGSKEKGTVPGKAQGDTPPARSGLNIRMGQKKPSSNSQETSKPPEANRSPLGIALKVGKPPKAVADGPKPKESDPTTHPQPAPQPDRPPLTIAQVPRATAAPTSTPSATEGVGVVPKPKESQPGAAAKALIPPKPKGSETIAPASSGPPGSQGEPPQGAALPVPKPPETTVPVPVAAPVAVPKVEKREEKQDWLVRVQQEPESLQSLLEPEPEEVARLKQGYKQHRFMAQSVILEESGLSNQVRSAMFAVSLLIVAFFVWASFSSMDEIASTQGQVMPSSPAQLIQHLEGGIIREILVQEGQIVKKDALLVRLDSEGVLADLNQLKAKRASLQAQEIRIRAVLSGKDANFNEIDQQYQSFIQGQHLLLLAQRSALASERGVLETRISRSRSRIENLLVQQQNIEKQRASLSQELGMKDQGYEQGVVSRLAVLGSQRDFARIEAEEVRNQGDLTAAKRELEEALGDLDELLKKARETNLRELAAVTTDLAQAEEQSRRLSDRVQRLEVRSPVWGVVNNLQVNTVGGVITPGALIAEIIPMDSTRRVETRISTRDIGHVAVGQTVTVKVTTYDFARYGGINGILESVSPTTFKQQDEKEPFYKGIIRLDQPYVGKDEKKNPVLPGMTVQADIDTGSKTLMEYMLKPIYASVNKAFRER
ncbi:MAG: HlyD family type I secretion periplasmic adaptor subunit [Magnetococcales bacterium]|nr:HlyD family type I secretion periplasmic adaptor subunit [Magnetococcales bacterium]